MGRILFAWELGSNFGHLARDLRVAEQLRRVGHEVLFAVRDTRIASEILVPHGFPFVQAPISSPSIRLVRPLASYAEILLAEGWGDRTGLLGRLSAWRALISWTRPLALVADHAPSALLAAKIAGIPAVAFGSGFEIPPAVAPLPSFRPWAQTPSAWLEQSESIVLDAINSAMGALGADSLESVSGLFPKTCLLATFAELDHYGERPGADYIGSVHGLETASTVDWPKGDGTRIFAYLRPNQRATSAVLAALAASNFNTLCAAPGADRTFLGNHTFPNLSIHPGPAAFDTSLSSDGIMIHYGGIGTMAMGLMAGVPQIIVPSTVEQFIGAQKIDSLGAGIALPAKANQDDVRAALLKVNSNSSYRKAAHNFAEKYRLFDPQASAHQAAETIIATSSI